MIELTNISNELQVKITAEESRVILPLQEQNVINFLKNFTKIIRCSEKEESLDNKKALFDLFIKEVIFDGVSFLIIMKTTDEPENEIADKKKEVNQKVFGLLPFGDLAGNRTRDCAVRGRRLNRLTTRPHLIKLVDYIISKTENQAIFTYISKKYPPVP